MHLLAYSTLLCYLILYLKVILFTKIQQHKKYMQLWQLRIQGYKMTFKSEIFLLDFFSQKKKVDRSEDCLHPNLSFLRPSVPRYNNLHFYLERFFPLKILPGFPFWNKISKSYCVFVVLKKFFWKESILGFFQHFDQQWKIQLECPFKLLQSLVYRAHT